MFPALVSYLILGLASGDALHQQASQRASTKRSENNDAIRRDLAERVAGTLKSARSLVMEVEIRAEPHRLRVLTEMAPALLRTRVYDLSNTESCDLDRPDTAFLFKNGVMSEYRAVWRPENGLPLKSVLLQYPAVFAVQENSGESWTPDPNGSQHAILGHPTDCLIGSYIQSWVGPFSEKAGYFAGVIGEGEISPIHERISDSDCIVVTKKQEMGNYIRIDRYYFDKDKMLPRRWQTLEREGEGEPKVTRVRDFVKIHIDEQTLDSRTLSLPFVGTRQQEALSDSEE
ncbi:MAG: hypothetical protein HS101_08535 [Planctomycetia bacterium]|jgi:hypothetical protein|nr:hypothetical protein [Planctomycetia bacterium]MCC7315305.1 hypothetical protein [Planctomycetota bacterium]OQZ06884.1 MAG: hypothetical protein B6D36_02730 [Planctomycetes bacterium UTPLA1]